MRDTGAGGLASTALRLVAWLLILGVGVIDLLALRLGWHIEVEAARFEEEGVGGLLLSVLVGMAGGVAGAIWGSRSLKLGTTVYYAVLSALMGSAVAVLGLLVPYLGSGAVVWGLPNLLSLVGVVIGRTAAGRETTSVLLNILGPLLGVIVFTLSPLAITPSVFSAVPLVAGVIIGAFVWTLRIAHRRR